MTGIAPWPVFEDDEVAAVDAVLRSGKVNYWTGQQGREFEKEFAQFCGLEHAVFVANGTLALELALRSLDLPAGSEVITTPHTFIATASSIVAVGLQPVFADVDLNSGNITAETIEAKITEATSAVIVVHLGGWPAEMPKIQELCRRRGLRLIEDCAQAHGAMIGDRHVGTFSDIAAWSFCQDKIISTGGEGGMVATNDPDIWQRAWSYKDHGKSWDAVYNREHPPGFRWLHENFGSNWRGTEMQAAIGRIQYRKLPTWHEQRRENAELLAQKLKGVPEVTVPECPPDYEHAFYRLYGLLDVDRLAAGWTRDRFLGEVTARSGIPVFSGSCSEVYREKAFAGRVEPLAGASERGEKSLAFLVHPGMCEADFERMVSAISEVLAEATS